MGSIFSCNKNPDKNPLSDEVTQGYFDDLQTIFIHNYKENHIRIRNIKICSEEKNFDQIIEEGSTTEFQENNDNSQENHPTIISEPLDFINWLDYLYHYLEEEKNKDRIWAQHFLDKLDQEYFLMENKYLSQFFFEEYGIMSIPGSLCKKKKREKKINVNTSVLNVTQNLGGSFGESFNQYESESDAGYKYKETRNKVKGYINIFKEHILNTDHPINIVAQIFESVWVDFAKNKLEEMKYNFGEPNEESKKEIEKEIGDLTYQFQRFMIKLQVCLKLFYSRTIDFSFFTQEKDELINLTTFLVFRTGHIYETMFSLYAYGLSPEITEMSIKYQKLRTITPEDLGISRQFCLDKETLDLQEEILEKQLKEVSENEEEEEKNKEKKEKIDAEKGVMEFDIVEKPKESKNIKTMIMVIKDRKNRIPKPGQRNIDDMEVNLHFDDDNSDEDNNINILGKNDSMLIESNNLLIGSMFPRSEIADDILPSANVSVDNATLFKRPGFNINDTTEYLISTNINNNNNINPKPEKKEFLFAKKSGFEPSEETTNDPNLLIVRDPNAERKNVVPLMTEKILGKVSFLRQNKDDCLSYPYETAIQLLKQIRKYKTPFEKMMIIANISNEITECINDFWKIMEHYFKKDILNIEAEQIMTIFIYIIIKSGITDIFVHYKMIKLFTTCMTKSSTIGYYYATAEASIMFIRTLKNIDELFKNKGKNKIFGD